MFMATFLLVIHLMIAAALVGVVLLQRSEGGALGIGGGGGGGGGFLTGRGTANLLTRVTAGLAAAFFLTSLLLTILAGANKPQGSLIGREAPASQQTPAVPGGTPPGGAGQTGTGAPTDQSGAPAPRGGVLDRLQGQQPSFPPKQ
jgi:preprotein translocase subunit SecG